MPQRFPNQWSTKSVVWTPMGTRIEGSGPITDEAGTLLLALISKPKLTDAELKLMRAFAKKFCPGIAKAAESDRKKLDAKAKKPS